MPIPSATGSGVAAVSFASAQFIVMSISQIIASCFIMKLAARPELLTKDMDGLVGWQTKRTCQHIIIQHMSSSQ